MAPLKGKSHVPARIDPTTSQTAPDDSKPLLEGLRKVLGRVPNLYATMGHSPATLRGFLAFEDALAKGALSPREAELVKLHVSELNGCAYCVSAHTAVAARLGLSKDESVAARTGQARNAREAAILGLARRIVRTGGTGAGTELAAAREAGLTDAEIVEIVAQVAGKAFSNALAILAQTDIDFPKAPRLPES
jgi:uncharacterized peroxidase-related enzyme